LKIQTNISGTINYNKKQTQKKKKKKQEKRKLDNVIVTSQHRNQSAAPQTNLIINININLGYHKVPLYVSQRRLYHRGP